MTTKKEREQLKAISIALPAEASKTLEVIKVTGADLLRLNPMAIDEKGKPIVRSLTYTVNRHKPVNHFKEIIKAYIQGGVLAVDKYCTEVRERWELDQKVKEN